MSYMMWLIILMLLVGYTVYTGDSSSKIRADLGAIRAQLTAIASRITATPSDSTIPSVTP